MSVSIQGLGPRFRLLINLANEGEELATNLQVGGVDVQISPMISRCGPTSRCQFASVLHHAPLMQPCKTSSTQRRDIVYL